LFHPRIFYHHFFAAPLCFNGKIAPEMLLPPIGNPYTPYTSPATGVPSAFNPALPTPPINAFRPSYTSTLANAPAMPTGPVRPFPICLPPLPPPVLNDQLLISPSIVRAQLAADTWCRASASNRYYANSNQNQQTASPYITTNPAPLQPDYAGYMHRFIDNYRDTGMADSTFHWLNDTYHQCRGPMMNVMGRLVMHG
jgi:hypothetical protein